MLYIGKVHSSRLYCQRMDHYFNSRTRFFRLNSPNFQYGLLMTFTRANGFILRLILADLKLPSATKRCIAAFLSPYLRTFRKNMYNWKKAFQFRNKLFMLKITDLSCTYILITFYFLMV